MLSIGTVASSPLSSVQALVANFAVTNSCIRQTALIFFRSTVVVPGNTGFFAVESARTD